MPTTTSPICTPARRAGLPASTLSTMAPTALGKPFSSAICGVTGVIFTPIIALPSRSKVADVSEICSGATAPSGAPFFSGVTPILVPPAKRLLVALAMSLSLKNACETSSPAPPGALFTTMLLPVAAVSGTLLWAPPSKPRLSSSPARKTVNFAVAALVVAPHIERQARAIGQIGNRQ